MKFTFSEVYFVIIVDDRWGMGVELGRVLRRLLDLIKVRTENFNMVIERIDTKDASEMESIEAAL